MQVALLTVLWLLLLLVFDPLPKMYDQRNNYTIEEVPLLRRAGVSEAIAEGVVLEERILATHNGFNAISLFFGTYSRTNDSVFEVTLASPEGTILHQQLVDASYLQDNAYWGFSFERQNQSAGKEYLLTVKGVNGRIDNSPSIWLVNGENGTALYTKQRYQMLWSLYPAAWIAMVVASYLCVMVCRKADEKSYLVISLSLGLLFVFFNPFAHALDEVTHFFKSYIIGNGMLHETVQNGVIGQVVSANFEQIDQLNSISLKKGIIEDFAKDAEFWHLPHAASILPLHHCIPAIGIAIAQVFTANSAVLIYAGRLVNYLFYVFVCYYAIKSTKYYKSLFFIVALLPANLWMAGSYSTDPSLLSTSLLLVSLCFKYRYSDETKMISLKDCALILWCGMMIISVKFFVYAPIALCFFMIPKRCFKSKQRGAMIGAAAVIVVLIVVWQFMVSGNFLAGGDSRGGDTDLVRQLKFMLQNPIGAIRVFVNYYRTTAMSHLTGTYAPGNYTGVSGLLSLACVFAAVIATDKFTLTSRERKNTNLFFIAVFAVIVLLSTASMYLRFTPVGSADIAGVQTRYFFPAMILLMAALANNRVKNESNTYGANVAMMLTVFLVTQLILQLNNAFA